MSSPLPKKRKALTHFNESFVSEVPPNFPDVKLGAMSECREVIFKRGSPPADTSTPKTGWDLQVINGVRTLSNWCLQRLKSSFLVIERRNNPLLTWE